MDTKDMRMRRPAVVAGLAAALGLTAALGAAPVVAAADDSAVPPVPQEQDQAVDAGNNASQTGSPEQPGIPEELSKGDQPGEPGGPEQSGDGVEGGQVGGPEQPGEPGNPEEPGNGEQPGDSEEPGAGNELEGPEESIEEGGVVETGQAQDPVQAEKAEPETTLPETSVANEAAEAGAGAGNANQQDDSDITKGTWVVKDDGAGLQRYYVDENGDYVKGLFNAVIDGVKSLFYGTNAGYVVRGHFSAADGYTYYADNEGRLHTGWLVTGERTGGALERYWFDSNGRLAKNRLVGASEGDASGYYAYAKGDGTIVRGKYDNQAGRVYLANNDGKLAEGSGWLVTGEYDGGGLQRYYIDGDSHAAVSGYFSTDAVGNLKAEGEGVYHYFGMAGQGYVLRGYGKGVRNDWMAADNDGKIAADEWVVTTAFGQGLQRYWFDAKGKMAKNRLVGASEGDASGYYAWALADGRILRGKWDNKAGRVYLADNDGRLAEGSGWLVTDKYDGGLQRYWIDEDAHAAVSGFFNFDGETHFGMAGQGYVLRGAALWGDVVLIADNDGVMVSSQGTGLTATTAHGNYAGNWLVTDMYSNNGLQRYFIVGVTGQSGYFAALLGEFSVGKNSDGSAIKYYGRDDTGYVVRGYYMAPNGKMYYGDNDGVLDDYGFLTAAGRNLWNIINGKSSYTNYLVAVDRVNSRVVVFYGSAGNWNPIYDWACANGNPIYNNGQGTITGDFYIGGGYGMGPYADSTWNPGDPMPSNSNNYRDDNWEKSSVLYFTGFCLNLGFHSKVYNSQYGYSDPNQVGRISHGCIRLDEWQAKFIFDNCLRGTRVFVL